MCISNRFSKKQNWSTVSFWVMKVFWNHTEVLVTQHCECVECQSKSRWVAKGWDRSSPAGLQAKISGWLRTGDLSSWLETELQRRPVEGPSEEKDQEHKSPVPAALTPLLIPPCPPQPLGTLPQTLLEPPGRVQRQLDPSGSWLMSEKTWVPVSTAPVATELACSCPEWL